MDSNKNAPPKYMLWMVDRYRLRSAMCVGYPWLWFSTSRCLLHDRRVRWTQRLDAGRRAASRREQRRASSPNLSATRKSTYQWVIQLPPCTALPFVRMTTRVTFPTKSLFFKGVFACFIWTVFINPFIVIGNNFTVLNVINMFVQL